MSRNTAPVLVLAMLPALALFTCLFFCAGAAWVIHAASPVPAGIQVPPDLLPAPGEPAQTIFPHSGPPVPGLARSREFAVASAIATSPGHFHENIICMILTGILLAATPVAMLAVIASGNRLFSKTTAGNYTPNMAREARIAQLESELEQANEAADLYLDTMSHDIANLNHIAMGYLELAAIKLDLGVEEKELVEKPRKAIETTTKLIRYMKSIGRIKSRSLELNTLDLDRVIATAIEQCWQQNDATLMYRPQPGALIQGTDLLIEAFAILIETSVSLSSDPADIDIELSSLAENNATYYRVTIENQGPGLPDEYNGRLFVPQKAGQLTGVLKGPGLHMAKTVIEACGGRISGEDRTEGGYVRGCRFVVLLPATGVTGEAPGTGSSKADI